MKQVILIRDDLNMSQGKSIAQGSHVSVKATRATDENLVEEWLDEGGKKIVLRVSSRQELMDIVDSASEELPTATIDDLGYTEIEAGTTTAGAIGPSKESVIDNYTDSLELFD